MVLEGNQKFVWYDRSFCIFTFLCLITSYSLITKKVRKVKAASQIKTSQRNDVLLALQGGIVAFLMISLDLGFTIIPIITENKWWLLVSSILYVVAIGSHPMVYLIVNVTIRKRMFSLIHCNSQDALMVGNPVSLSASNLERSGITGGGNRVYPEVD